MRFWVELKDHVPNGQTVTSLLRFNTFNTKQTYNESMSGGKGVAAVTPRSTKQMRVDLSNQHVVFLSEQLQRANEVSLLFVKQHVLNISFKITTISYIFHGICP